MSHKLWKVVSMINIVAQIFVVNLLEILNTDGHTFHLFVIRKSIFNVSYFPIQWSASDRTDKPMIIDPKTKIIIPYNQDVINSNSYASQKKTPRTCIAFTKRQLRLKWRKMAYTSNRTCWERFNMFKTYHQDHGLHPQHPSCHQNQQMQSLVVSEQPKHCFHK